MDSENPLLQAGGLPRFTAIRPEHIEPAVRKILAENRAELEHILASGASGWQQIVVPLEEMEDRLNRIWSPVRHLNSVLNSEALREAHNNCLPLLSAYATEIGQNEDLFRRFREIATLEGNELGYAERKVIDDALRDFHLAGVDLPGSKKARFKYIMQELAQLGSRFEENVLDCMNAFELHVEDETVLAGLPEPDRERAREAARLDGREGWLFDLDYPTYTAVMTHAQNRDLRLHFYRAWSTRASDQSPQGAQWDNREVIGEILRLRHEAAELLGFANYAAYSLATKMAKSEEEVTTFLEDLARRSRPLAEQEIDELRAGADHLLEAWDVSFYAERLKRERFRVSEEALRPYFPVTRVIPGLLRVAESLYGLRIREVAGVDVWHPQVRYYEITDVDGQPRGGFYLDLFARKQKRGGAWMDECLVRKHLGTAAQLPVAYLVCNFPPPVGKAPSLLTHSDVVTLFHEFGHALHHLLTRVDIPSVAGINGVPWDAVELPSQFMENFAWRSEVLPWISGHYATGEPLPAEQFERLLGTRSFMGATQMLRQLEFALFDFRLHREYQPGDGAQIEALLEDVRRRVAVVPVPSFNRFANSFSHIFAGGYAAGYYSYKWAEVLAADAFGAFEEAGIFDPETAQRFLKEILETGGTRDAMHAYVAFRGREPELEPLLRQCGIRQAA